MATKSFGREKIQVTDANYHRNGVCGIGFWLIRFSFKGDDRKRVQAIATVFNTAGDATFDGHCAVISLGADGKPEIHNCWRGDHFEEDLRTWLKTDDAKKMIWPFMYPKVA